MDTLQITSIKLNGNYIEIGVTLTPQSGGRGRPFMYFYPKTSAYFEMIEETEIVKGEETISTNFKIDNSLTGGSVIITEADLMEGKISDGSPKGTYTFATLLEFLVTNTGA